MKARSQSQSAQRRNPRQQRAPARARVGLVMGRDMDYGGLPNAESIFAEMGVRLAPMSCADTPHGVDAPGTNLTVLPTADVSDIMEKSVAGVVVPGGATPGASEASTFTKLIATTRAEGLPIMAFGEGVPRTLGSLGLETDRVLPRGVLLQDEDVRLLDTADDVREAVSAFIGEGAAA